MQIKDRIANIKRHLEKTKNQNLIEDIDQIENEIVRLTVIAYEYEQKHKNAFSSVRENLEDAICYLENIYHYLPKKEE